MTTRPSLDPDAARLVALAESLGEPPLEQQTPTQARALRRARLRPATETVHERRDLDAGGVPARLYRPNADHGVGLLVYFHGGGWVIGDLDSHDNLCRMLANRSGAAVLSIDYRLAPEHPWPAAIDDAEAATRWAAANPDELGIDPERLAVGGDSAGANLATIVAQQRTVPLRFQLLVYPATDARLDAQYDSYLDSVDGPMLTLAGMRWFYDHYLGRPSPASPASPTNPASPSSPASRTTAVDRTDQRVSPLLVDDERLRALPRTLVLTASHDPLRDEGEAYARRLMDAGVATTLTRYQGAFHGFFNYPDVLPIGLRAVEEAAAALGRALR